MTFFWIQIAVVGVLLASLGCDSQPSRQEVVADSVSTVITEMLADAAEIPATTIPEAPPYSLIDVSRIARWVTAASITGSDIVGLAPVGGSGVYSFQRGAPEFTKPTTFIFTGINPPLVGSVIDSTLVLETQSTAGL